MFFRPNVAKMARQHDVPGLTKVLSSHDPKLRASAVDALGQIGAIDVVASLLWVTLTDTEETVWEVASRCFQQLAGLKDVLEQGFLFAEGDDETWVTHFHLFRHHPPRQEWVGVEIETLLRLGSLGVAVLYEGVRDKDWRVRESAAGVLRDVGSEPSDTATLAWYLVAVREWGRLDSVLTDAMEPLVAVLGHPSGAVRSNATRKLVRTGLPAIPALGSAILGSHSQPHVASAITALEQIASAEHLRGKPDPVVPQVREAISRLRVEQLESLEQALNEERRFSDLK